MDNPSEIQALIRLLDDDDDEIVEQVYSTLISFGYPVLSYLEDAWGGDALNADHNNRIEEIIVTIQFNSVYKKMENWCMDELRTIEDGALIVAQFFFPQRDDAQFRNELAKQKQKIWLELNNSYTPLENINIFNQVFYNILGYKGLKEADTRINNYCINQVVETKKGSAIAIGIVYILLAQSLELPVYGVNLHKHFILAFQKNFVFEYYKNNAADNLFYMNPITGNGLSFRKKDIQSYIENAKIASKLEYFEPASPINIIDELLKYILEHLVKFNRLEKIDKLLKLMELIEKTK